MKVAVVVPVKNEITGLRELVTSLQKQAAGRDEILFVDAGSTDGTQDVLREFAAKDPRIRLLVSAGAYPGKARNIAIRNTKADIIAQIDGGNLPEEHWLQNLIAPIVRGEADYVMGDVRVMPVRRRFLGRIMDMSAVYGATLYRGEFRCHSEAPPAGGASVAYWRWIWEKTGGFPEWCRFGEDPLHVRRVMPLHPRICFAPDAILHWQLGPTLDRILRRQIHRERIKFHNPVDLRQQLGILIPRTLLLILISAAYAIPRLWTPILFILGAMLVRQTAKSLKTYYRRTQPKTPDLLRAMLIFPFVDFLGIIARFAGTVQGIFQLRHIRSEWDTYRQYVTGGQV